MDVIIKYDQQNRIESRYLIQFNILYQYHYKNDVMKIYISCPSNKSNYKTIIKHIKVNEKYVEISKLEIGNVYISYYQFDNEKNLKFHRRFNRSTKSKFLKTMVINHPQSSVWIINYNNEKSIGFKINK